MRSCAERSSDFEGWSESKGAGWRLKLSRWGVGMWGEVDIARERAEVGIWGHGGGCGAGVVEEGVGSKSKRNGESCEWEWSGRAAGLVAVKAATQSRRNGDNGRDQEGLEDRGRVGLSGRGWGWGHGRVVG